MASANVFDAGLPAVGVSSRTTDAEKFRAELRRLLRHVTRLIDDESMSPCVRQSLGNLAVISGLQGEVYPSAVARAVQMAEASDGSAE